VGIAYEIHEYISNLIINMMVIEYYKYTLSSILARRWNWQAYVSMFFTGYKGKAPR
jgi:hypothetical protein